MTTLKYFISLIKPLHRKYFWSASDITRSCQAKEEERRRNFARLVMMDSQALLPNPEPVECRICYMDLQPGDGVILRECLHCFCRLEMNIMKTKDFQKCGCGRGWGSVCFLAFFSILNVCQFFWCSSSPAQGMFAFSHYAKWGAGGALSLQRWQLLVFLLPAGEGDQSCVSQIRLHYSHTHTCIHFFSVSNASPGGVHVSCSVSIHLS